MNAEVIAIGTEILLGEIVDTNSARVARAVRDIGLDLLWISAVGDNEARIADAVRQAARRSTVVITTGGLGPTVDDPTRAAIARAFDLDLEFRPELWAQIEARFERFGRTPTPNNRKQAYVPQGALALENAVGTAPCFALETEGSMVISLPGVPRELEHMLEHKVIPLLRERYQLSGVIRAKVLRTVGLGESQIDARISEFESLANPTVGLAAHPGQTDVRITAKAPTAADADALIAPIEAEIRRRLGQHIYAEGKATIEDVVGELLTARAATLAVAEDGTQGRLVERLKASPAAANLRLSTTLADPSDQSAQALAELTRQSQAAHWGLAVVVREAGEGRQLDVALASVNGVEQTTMGYGGHPELAVTWAVTAALNMLRLALMRQPQQ